MSSTLVLGQRALREAWRTPDALIPTLLIPLFFLVVNVGQAGQIFPAEPTPWLEGQSYAGFQLPVSIMLAASFGSAALYLVEEIENGYFDKLRATPVPRTSIVLGRLTAEPVKMVAMTIVMIIIALPFGVRISTGLLGVLLLVLLAAGWAVGYTAFLQFVALKSRSAAATNSAGLVFFPLLFLTPNFVPRNLLTDPMEVAATLNPVTYLMEAMRSLILGPVHWGTVGLGFLVVAVFAAIMVGLNVLAVRSYD